MNLGQKHFRRASFANRRNLTKTITNNKNDKENQTGTIKIEFKNNIK